MTEFDDEAEWRADQARTAYQPEEWYLSTWFGVLTGTIIALALLAVMFHVSGYDVAIVAWWSR